MKPLPAGRWDIVEWRSARVGKDWRIQVKKAFYSVPYEHIGREVRVCVNSHWVVVYYEFAEITRHRKARRNWERVVKEEHGPPNYKEYLLTTSSGVRRWGYMLGEAVGKVTEAILNRRGVDGLRPARALCALSKKCGPERLDRACRRALHYGMPEYMFVKNILAAGTEQELLPGEEPEPEKQQEFKYARGKEYFNIT